VKIRCLIIDDEPLAQRVVEKFIEDIPTLELAGKCKNAIEAIQFLDEKDVDLMFLDVNMPKLSGVNFLKTLKNPPFVILTTAYSEYAIEGYELDVIDFLIKPFSFERFLKAINKAHERLHERYKEKNNLSAPVDSVAENRRLEDEYIFVKSNKKSYKINYSDLFYVEALGDYIKIYTSEKVIITYSSMKGIEAALPAGKFMRIHKSFIINISKIKTIEGNEVEIMNRKLPIGSNYKQDFLNSIHSA
jgi:DNA-binding LytR/AlgR family response regulator